MYLIALAGLVLLPFLFVLVLRANSSIAFLSLCLGSVLALHVAPDIADVITAASRGDILATTQWAQVVLVITPFVLATLFTRATVWGGKQLLNGVNAFAAGALFALLLTPYLPLAWQNGIHSLVLWQQLDNLQTALLIVGSVISLFFLLMTRPHHRADKKHGK